MGSDKKDQCLSYVYNINSKSDRFNSINNELDNN